MSEKSRSGRAGARAEGKAEDPGMEPGKRSLTDGLGRPSRGAHLPGRRALTDGLVAGKQPSPDAVPPEIATILASARGVVLPDPEAWSRKVGADVSHARIVTGEGAPEAAKSMGARAFTVGNRVFFGAGNDPATDGGSLLAHELTHVVQQQGAPAPASYDKLPVVAYGDAREAEARAGISPSAGTSEQALARDAEKDVDAGPYRKAFAKEIGEGIIAYLAGHALASGSRFVVFPGPLTAGPTILGVTGADLEAKLDGWLGRHKVDDLVNKARPMGREQLTDGDKTWIDDKWSSGPGRWFPDVAVEIAASLYGLLRTSLDRVVPRFQGAAVAIGIAAEERAKANLVAPPKPVASDIVASHPIDVETIRAVIDHATFDFQAYRSTYPAEKGQLGQLRPVTITWLPPRNGTYWARVSPADATIEEVANTLYGTSQKSSELAVAAAPLFGFANATLLTPAHQEALTKMGADIHVTGDVLKEATTGSLADEIAQNQGAQTPGKAATKGAVLRTIDETLAVIPTIEVSGKAFGMGKNPAVASMATLTKRLTDRRAKIAASNEEDALKWAGQTEAQQLLLSQVAFGFDREAKRLADLTKLVTDATVKLGGFNLPPYVREAMNHVAMRYADCALISDVPQTAAAKLAEVEDEAGALPVAFLEGTLASIQRTLDDARNAKHDKQEHESYDVPGMAGREQQLKSRLAAVRAQIKTDPEGATKELKELSVLLSDLQVETEMVANMDQIDAAWQALEDGVSFWWSSVITQYKASNLKDDGDRFHKRWKDVFSGWKSSDPKRKAQAKTDFEQLRADKGLGEWLGKVQSILKSAQIERLIGQLVVLVAITVVTAGVGDLVVAGAAGWELSAGATAVLAGGAEAATFTVLSQIFLDSDHSFGHVVYEFGTNWAMFGVMRRFQMFAEVAKLSKVSAVGGNVLILAATTFAKADLDKYIKEGRHLSSDEVKMIALQGMAMAIAMHAIAPMTKPLFAELEGSAYAFTSKLKANNRMQETLTVQTEALKGSRDFAQAQEYVGKEKAWLEERLRILDEVEAAAKKESEGGKQPPGGGIAGKIKMSAKDLGALRSDLQGKLGSLKEGTLPLLTLEPKGPGLFTCPREHIRDVVQGLGEVQKTIVDPKTTVVRYEVKLPDNTTITVMEKIDPASDWVAHLKSELAPDALARLEVEMKGKTPQEIMDHFHGNADVAIERLSTKGGDSPSTAKDTLDMFGVGEIPKDGNARWQYKNDPNHWTAERRALHDRLITKAKQQAQAFADATQKGEPTIYAMRGNTAAGKTRAVSGGVPELAGPMAKTKELPHRSVNPDNFKADLIEASGGSMTSSQVHWESSMLAERLEGELLTMKTSDGKELGSMLIDKRLANAGDVSHYAKLAKDSGRKFVLYDVDAPLEVSLAGVLERVPGGADPLPPFDIVAGGFKGVRSNRQAVVDMFLADSSLGTYEIYGTRANGDRVPVATVKNGALEIKDAGLYREVMAEPGNMGEVLASKRITEDGIQAVIGGLEGDRGTKVGNLLRKYLGWTWKAALDAHSKEKPLLKPAPGTTP